MRQRTSFIFFFLTFLLLVLGTAGCKEPFDRSVAHLIFTHHALCRMKCRHITENEIREILEKGVVNYSKSEPGARPDPKFAMEGYTHGNQHLRIIIAPSSKEIVIVTCIDLGVEWQCDC